MELDFEREIVELENKIAELNRLSTGGDVQFHAETAELRRKLDVMVKRVYANLTPWQIVQIARHAKRPTIRDFIAGLCSEFVELHGDRAFGDDQGIIGGLATIEGRRMVLLGHQKGRTVEENIRCNFGMATPDGYRKALRLMKLAEKYRIPVLSLIDTPGAYPGADAEARGQAEAIARNLAEMSTLQTPIVVVVTGEGGSGGAIGIGVGDIVMMLSNAVYSVISPEGCASILWRDGTKAAQAAEALKITAPELLKLGIIDEIIPEPAGGAHRNHPEIMKTMKQVICKQMDGLHRVATRKLVERRYEKFTRMGRFAGKAR